MVRRSFLDATAPGGGWAGLALGPARALEAARRVRGGRRRRLPPLADRPRSLAEQYGVGKWLRDRWRCVASTIHSRSAVAARWRRQLRGRAGGTGSPARARRLLTTSRWPGSDPTGRWPLASSWQAPRGRRSLVRHVEPDGLGEALHLRETDARLRRSRRRASRSTCG